MKTASGGTWGGKRKGAGKPKGVLWPTTIAGRVAKAEARELVRQAITAELQPLINAQISNAIGIKYLVARDPKTGKFERIGPEGLTPDATIEVWQKDPSVQAFTELLNRALDKSADQPASVAVTGDLKISWQSPK